MTLRSTILSPGFPNIAVCNLLTASIVLVPVALVFAVRFSDENSRCLQEHYHYVRTTIAIFVLGICAAGLLILAGAALSTALILAGLALIFVTVTLVLTRSVHALALAIRKEALRNYKSFLV